METNQSQTPSSRKEEKRWPTTTEYRPCIQQRRKEVRLRPTATENQPLEDDIRNEGYFVLLQKLMAKKCLFSHTSFQGITKLRPFILKKFLKIILNTNKLKKVRNYRARNPKNYQGMTQPSSSVIYLFLFKRVLHSLLLPLGTIFKVGPTNWTTPGTLALSPVGSVTNVRQQNLKNYSLRLGEWPHKWCIYSNLFPTRV